MVNLDNLDCEELWDFWEKHQGGRNYLDLFPEGGLGTKTATKSLANYAANTATAMRCRLKGSINDSMMYEKIADSIYNELPRSMRW